MNNSEIAHVFKLIGDLLEIKGDNPFRIRSYRNAVDIIENMPGELTDIVEGGKSDLTEIKGIGKAIAEKIEELVKTGKLTFVDDLLKELPSGLLDMLRVSGLGPKKVKMFYEELNITGLDELEEAIRSGKLDNLKGMGAKSIEKLKRGIEDCRSLLSKSDRTDVATALFTANEYIEYLSELKVIKKIDYAGSLRRFKETIGDIDILVGVKDTGQAREIMDHFVAYNGVREVLVKGDTKSSIVLKSSMQVDLRVVDIDNFGSSMQYFTGSKAHNVALRDRAKKMGFKLNEYGLFDEKTEELVASKKEEDIYKALNLRYIEPGLRENTGEIEAAELNKLPKLIKLKEIQGDLHMHTTASDGANSIEEMARSAIELGYKYIAITDHSKSTGIANGLDKARLLKQIKAIDKVNEKLLGEGFEFTVLKGSEVDILTDGTLDYDNEMLGKLDIVVAAVHSNFNMDGDAMTKRILSAVESGMVDIIAHPTGRLINEREPYRFNMERIMDACVEHGVALELNSYLARLDLKDTHLKMAKERGIKIAISSDAHSAAQLSNVHYGVLMANRGWIEKSDVLNAMPLKKLKEALA